MNYDVLTTFSFLAPLGVFLYPVLGALAIWTLVFKGLALWKAARAGDTGWFVVLLIVNTFGILEVVYLVWFAKKEVPTVAPAPAPAPQALTPEA